MKWIEVIHLRSIEQNSEKLETVLHHFLNSDISDKGLSGIDLLRRESIKSDICIQLHHEVEKLVVPGSRVGIHLAKKLEAFGMINHTLWKISSSKKA